MTVSENMCAELTQKDLSSMRPRTTIVIKPAEKHRRPKTVVGPGSHCGKVVADEASTRNMVRRTDIG